MEGFLYSYTFLSITTMLWFLLLLKIFKEQYSLKDILKSICVYIIGSLTLSAILTYFGLPTDPFTDTKLKILITVSSISVALISMYFIIRSLFNKTKSLLFSILFLISIPILIIIHIILLLIVG
ncbi:hypothetical protein IGQ_05545 [Bacillus cereus IS195]|nr:hypothetical protein IAU_04496 [Bacillus cereus IS075]EOO83254.1 hypothetical protein IGS_05491 [Bacillus cereus IS845/00]EOO92923.1 hypothetical protein IGQ_05545 [Bacillus cereus IS195]